MFSEWPEPKVDKSAVRMPGQLRAWNFEQNFIVSHMRGQFLAILRLWIFYCVFVDSWTFDICSRATHPLSLDAPLLLILSLQPNKLKVVFCCHKCWWVKFRIRISRANNGEDQIDICYITPKIQGGMTRREGERGREWTWKKGICLIHEQSFCWVSVRISSC